jgi:hypothetical protein
MAANYTEQIYIRNRSEQINITLLRRGSATPLQLQLMSYRLQYKYSNEYCVDTV